MTRSGHTKESWRELYPFTPHYACTPDGFRQHFLDEGEGFPVVMLHGIPTWSFMYRDLIPAFTNRGRRAIVPDNIGCGLSEKPQNWNYCLANHVKNLEHLLDEELHLGKFDLVMHDWGGAIGMGYAVRHPEKVRRIVLMNTAAFQSNECPKFVWLVRAPYLGAFLVRVCNLLVEGSLRLAPVRRLDSRIKAGYRFPYGNYHDRIATQRFAQDLPFSPSHQTWDYLKDLEQALPQLSEREILLCWGEKDFCFNLNFLHRWQKIYPQARTATWPDASHYLLEDCPEKIIPLLCDFSCGTPHN